MDALSDSSTKIHWKIDYLFTAENEEVVLKVGKKHPKSMDTEFQYFDSSLAQWKHRDNTCWPDVTSF